jgi:hypothetical protein
MFDTRQGKGSFSHPRGPDELRGLPSLLSRGKSGRVMKLTVPFYPLSRSTMVELKFHSPINIQGVALTNRDNGTFCSLLGPAVLEQCICALNDICVSRSESVIVEECMQMAGTAVVMEKNGIYLLQWAVCLWANELCRGGQVLATNYSLSSYPVKSVLPSVTRYLLGTNLHARDSRYGAKKKLHGLSPRANYTDLATAACWRRDCQLLRIEGATWSACRIQKAVFSVF